MREKEWEKTKGITVWGEKEEKEKNKKGGLTDVFCHLQIPRR